MAFEESELVATGANVIMDTESALQKAIRETVAGLREMDRGYHSFTSADFRLLARGLQLTLTVLSASLGECEADTPYSPLRPVRKPDGTLKWCCNHKPEHCT